MPSYSTLDYPEVHKKLFYFLCTEYHYKLINCERDTFDYIHEYRNNNIRIVMDYDIRENRFGFHIIKGYDTKFPRNYNKKEVIMFHDLFERHEEIPFGNVMPDEKQYIESLKLNARLLRKYGEKVLRGEEWI